MTELYDDGVRFRIYHTDDGYILHNYKIDGFRHTHLKNYKTCLYLIELSDKKKCPNDLKKYLLVSLLRINDDEIYCKKINNVIYYRRRKQSYKNRVYKNNKNKLKGKEG